LQFDGAGELSHRYLHGPIIDQIFADENAMGEVLWALTDHLGTVRQIVSNANEADKIGYDSFGRMIVISVQNESTFGFAGRELDIETGSYYYRSRFLDVENGRFLSEDHIAFASGDTNLYRYVQNLSITLVDPFGYAGASHPVGAVNIGRDTIRVEYEFNVKNGAHNLHIQSNKGRFNKIYVDLGKDAKSFASQIDGDPTLSRLSEGKKQQLLQLMRSGDKTLRTRIADFYKSLPKCNISRSNGTRTFGAAGMDVIPDVVEAIHDAADPDYAVQRRDEQREFIQNYPGEYVPVGGFLLPIFLPKWLLEPASNSGEII